jgi:hypothetical protein
MALWRANLKSFSGASLMSSLGQGGQSLLSTFPALQGLQRFILAWLMHILAWTLQTKKSVVATMQGPVRTRATIQVLQQLHVDQLLHWCCQIILRWMRVYVCQILLQC